MRTDSSAIHATTVNSTPASRVTAPQRRLWRRPVGRLIIIALVVLGVRTFVGEASVVPTGSMEGTILIGDHLFLDKMLYGPEIPLLDWRLPRLKSVRRGDIVAFRYPRDPEETFVKRVVAVGGDVLEIRDSRLFINSQAIDEPYVLHRFPLRSAHEHVGPIQVPPGSLFVMGDNRDNSSDSREWGFVPAENVIGEPLLVYWSYDAPTARWLDRDLGKQMAFYASIIGNFFSHTRWARTGMLL